jgi:hypothetical protein
MFPFHAVASSWLEALCHTPRWYTFRRLQLVHISTVNDSKKGRNNVRSLFQVEELPSDQQIRNLVGPLSAEHFQTDFWFLLDELKEQQGLL